MSDWCIIAFAEDVKIIAKRLFTPFCCILLRFVWVVHRYHHFSHGHHQHHHPNTTSILLILVITTLLGCGTGHDNICVSLPLSHTTRGFTYHILELG